MSVEFYIVWVTSIIIVVPIIAYFGRDVVSNLEKESQQKKDMEERVIYMPLYNLHISIVMAEIKKDRKEMIYKYYEKPSFDDWMFETKKSLT